MIVLLGDSVCTAGLDGCIVGWSVELVGVDSSVLMSNHW